MLGSICIFIIFSSNIFSNEQPVDPVEIFVEPVIREELYVQDIVIPVELHIDSIEIRAQIELVGVSDKEMGVPLIPENVGWYKFGAHPGDVGSAVLAGHVNWENNHHDVFTNLRDVAIGDTIEVKNSDEETISFLVHNIKRYPLDADTEEVFSSDDGLAHLNLITCGGSWNPIIESHELRLVVFSTKI